MSPSSDGMVPDSALQSTYWLQPRFSSVTSVSSPNCEGGGAGGEHDDKSLWSRAAYPLTWDGIVPVRPCWLKSSTVAAAGWKFQHGVPIELLVVIFQDSTFPLRACTSVGTSSQRRLFSR